MNIDWSNPQVQVAMIGLAGFVVTALVGLGGVVVGGRISHKSAKEAAGIAAAAAIAAAALAQEESRLDRDEARRARFGDRILELAAKVLEYAGDYRTDVAAQIFWRMTETGPLPMATRDSRLPLAIGQLRMILRLQTTRTALDALDTAASQMEPFVWKGGLHPVKPDQAEIDSWNACESRYNDAAAGFMRSIATEVGVVSES